VKGKASFGTYSLLHITVDWFEGKDEINNENSTQSDWDIDPEDPLSMTRD
jgi:hypothetical protein